MLKTISIENFGLFRDRHTFDLSTKEGSSTNNKNKQTRTIILFGGKNGAGKTTLFEAFKLCLYGNTLPEFSNRQSDYNNYIKKRIHRFSGMVLQPSSAIVSLEFEYAKFGKVESFLIERRWHLKREGVDEEFDIKVNGKNYDEIEENQWQDFIKELIPIGVSKLFFFDGEQIQALAADQSDEARLRDSFYSLLGLDLVTRLQSDLQIHITRQLKNSDNTFATKLDALTTETEKLEQELEMARQNRASLENRRAFRKKKVDELQEKLTGEGGAFAKRHDGLKNSKIRLEVELDQENSTLRELCSGLLPFTLVPQYCNLLKNRLTQERQNMSQLTCSKESLNLITNIKQKVTGKVKSSDYLSDKYKKSLLADLKKIFETELPLLRTAGNKNNKQNQRNVKITPHLSDLDQNKILAWIDVVQNNLPRKIKNVGSHYENLTKELQKTQDLLRKVPADEVIGPIVDELNEINRELGQIDVQLNQTDIKISQIQYKLNQLDFQIRTLQSEKRDFEKFNRGMKLATKVQKAMEDYEKKIKKEKLVELSNSLVECLENLMHKKIFERVSIAEQTFEVTLYDFAGKPIPKEQLSAGEKQIYAIAMLWALAKTSRRALPFIIDTPLGRLDSSHRLNLVENFFPIASHQVIIFSTDTEIDKLYFENLSGHICRSFRLDYDKDQGQTAIKTGYFWR
jgi:DNA sulfur modification protein DndD